MQFDRRPGPSVRVRVTEYADGVRRAREDRLATEEPLEVRLRWPGVSDRRVAVTMRTPGNDFELAVGLLSSEGLLPAGGLASAGYCTDADLSAEERYNVVTIALHAPPAKEPADRGDTVTAQASACGVCGSQSIQEVQALALAQVRAAPPAPAVRLAPSVLQSLPTRLREAQRIFDSTGGLHAAALADDLGEVMVLREDIGRHNAVDKVIGARILADLPTSAPLLVVSGRVGFEIVQKAVAAGVSSVAALGAPSSLAVRLAREADLVLVGFLTADRHVIYAGADHVGV